MNKTVFSHLTEYKGQLSDEQVIHFLDHLIDHAQQQGASDLHIEPYEHSCRIRYRQDGLLYELTDIQPHLATRLSTRLKILADLDISERRLPQDGRFHIDTAHQKTLEVRLSSCPILHGEKIVLRLLDKSKMALQLDALGFTISQKNLFLQAITEPQGLVLVTGPTGSGKTVTLYSALAFLNSKEKNIVTIEDPVEIRLDGINQIPINPKIGLNFATALRAFLRQDPDIIMLGEIRDKETAEIAVQAAQTGHLVLSTLHSNSAIEALSRLFSMGIEPYLLTQTLRLIIAQRLVRKLCSHCKIPEPSTFSFRSSSCGACRKGYKGRTAIFECLHMSKQLAELTIKKKNLTILKKAAHSEGFISLWESGLEKAREGELSFEELLRVLPDNRA